LLHLRKAARGVSAHIALLPHATEGGRGRAARHTAAAQQHRHCSLLAEAHGARSSPCGGARRNDEHLRRTHVQRAVKEAREERVSRRARAPAPRRSCHRERSGCLLSACPPHKRATGPRQAARRARDAPQPRAQVVPVAAPVFSVQGRAAACDLAHDGQTRCGAVICNYGSRAPGRPRELRRLPPVAAVRHLAGRCGPERSGRSAGTRLSESGRLRSTLPYTFCRRTASLTHGSLPDR
jgi:hypothetical protein